MGVKETMAFIGGAGKVCPVLMKKLAQQHFRLLFVSKDEEQLEELSLQLGLEEVPSEIELVHCAKEGCWEADIIAFVDPEQIDDELMSRIKDVATQKIVLCISTSEKKRTDFSPVQMQHLEQSLPYSRIVWAAVDSNAMRAEVSGKDEEALQTISAIFEAPGYSTHSNKVEQ